MLILYSNFINIKIEWIIKQTTQKYIIIYIYIRLAYYIYI